MSSTRELDIAANGLRQGSHATHPVSPADLRNVHPSGRDLLRWAVWIGLAGGTLELAAFLLKCRWIDPRNVNVSREFVWMYPLAGLLITVGLAGLPLAALAGLRPGSVSGRAGLAALFFLAVIGPVFRLPVQTLACLVLALGLAWRAGKRLGAPRSVARFDGLVRRSLPVGMLLLGMTVLFGSSLGRSRAARAGSASAGAKNVLLVVLDTVRADSLGLDAGARAHTPALARIAARGARFDRAFSTAPWTAPSHASLFTGRWPRELSIGWSRPLDARFPTLAEYLGAHGYDTAGFVANTTYCSEETGLDRGFAEYHDYDVTLRSVLLCSALVQRLLNTVGKRPALASRLEALGLSGSQRKPAGRMNLDLLDWLDQRPPGQAGPPFFAFVNYYDAHHPYLPPEGPNPPAAELGLLRGWWGLDKRGLGPAEVEAVRAAYTRCVRSLDAQIGRLFEALEARGLLDTTLVILTADHGEHLGEQHLYGHGVSLYRPELHVPLIVLDPGSTRPGTIVRRPVSLRDVAATVVDRLGLARDGAPAPFPGHSLARAWLGTEDDGPDFPVVSEVAAPPEDDPNHGASPVARGPMTSIIADHHHYIRDGDGREELYNLDADPAESTNLVPNEPALLERLRALAP